MWSCSILCQSELKSNNAQQQRDGEKGVKNTKSGSEMYLWNKLPIVLRGSLASGAQMAAVLLTACAVFQTPLLVADDVKAPTQKSGTHSDVSTENGKIRDDEFVDFICQKIKENGKGVKDVKLMMNSCYGGGLLDDMERAFGPEGACPGIPWVAGAASAPDKTAGGNADETVKDLEETATVGSTWTDALAGNNPFNVNKMPGPLYGGSKGGGTVMDDFQSAADNDYTGQNGTGRDTPIIASGNGGDQIMWNMAGTKHEAIVFGGAQTDLRHHNNITNMTAGLKDTWDVLPPESPKNFNIQSLDGGTTQDLLNAIELATSRLDENTQLVIYIDDHGSSSFDFDEAIGSVADVLFEDEVSFEFQIPEGWFDGFFGNYFSGSSEILSPTLNLDINECNACSHWEYLINGVPVPFPGSDFDGLVKIPVPFWAMRPGTNYLIIRPRESSSNRAVGGSTPKTHLGTLRMDRMELTTGPINELHAFPRLLPGQSAAYFNPNRNGEGIFVELLDDEQVVVFVFTYTLNGPGQAWMLGTGRQVADGIIINEMLRPTGATFGPGFDPDDVMFNDFGSLAFHPPTCGTSEQPGSLFIYPPAETGYHSTINNNMEQLSQIVDCGTSVGSVNSPLSGSWFDPTHNGEGIILEVLEDGRAIVQWFTYDSTGNQMWIQGFGTFEGNTLTVDNLFTTQGSRWGANFDADDVTTIAWGTLTILFDGCGEAVLNYESSAGFGSGTLNLTRLTTLMGIACQD